MNGPGGYDPGDDPGGAGFNESPGSYGGWHRTLYDPYHDNHISWDTDWNDDYVYGTGHEDRNGHWDHDWDPG